MVERQSMWDEETRAQAVGLAEFEATICGCGCGQPMTEAYKAQPFKVEKVTCYAGRALAIARDEAAKEAKRKKAPEGHDRGVHYYVVPVDDTD